jgi:arylsulfatase A-like enzyme
MTAVFRGFRLCFLTTIFAVFGGACLPHVVLFLVDDFGAYDVSYAGLSVYETPEIDRLAADAVRVTQAYSAYPRCVPSRFGLMTGTHPSRAEGIGAQLGDMDSSRVTLAEALKAQGYATFFCR